MENEKLNENNLIVKPVITPAQAKQEWQNYQDLKRTIIEPEDIQKIQGKDFLKKSYWRKIATYFNLSVEITEEKMQTINGEIVFHFKARAIAPNGRFTEGSGSCSNKEKGRINSIHNTRTTAETRAFNRAISNMIGGEVSAEEIDQESPTIPSRVNRNSEWPDQEIKAIVDEVDKK